MSDADRVARFAGRPISELPTPALVLDLDVLQANLRRMASRCQELAVSLRPHVKTHKCLEIAERQRALGARGITVSTLAEAEPFLAHGFEDVTWAFPLVLSRLDQAARLSRTGRLGLTVDSPTALEALDAVGEPFRVWLEVDCGYGRSGVDPEDPASAELAGAIHQAPDLTLEGILTHAGHTYGARSPEEIARIAERERAVMTEFAAALRAKGVEVPAVSVGSTPGMSRVSRLDGVTEVRPGNYAFYDYTQASLGSCDIGDCAVTVVATVVSCRPAASHSVVDAGALALSKELGPEDEPPHYGHLFAELEGGSLDPEARIVSVSQEHGIVNRRRRVGSRVRILPNHSCLTAALFDAYHVVRGGRVVEVWKIWRNR